jgi:cation-transporting ATPase E
VTSAVDVGSASDAPPGPRGAPKGLAGLSDDEARVRLTSRDRKAVVPVGRSYASIVRANVLTVFNAILAGFGVLTLVFGDWRDALFLGVIVANSAIGITQEVRAKLELERLSLLVAPQARVRRGGAEKTVAPAEVVVGDLARLQPGEQVTADGLLLEAVDLRIDESILTGESEPAARAAGDAVRSGAFVVEGTGSYRVEAVGADSFAERITGEARSFRHSRSPLELAINRLLYFLVVLVFGLGALLAYSLYHRHVPLHTAVATSTAGVVSMIPEGLVVLMSLTYAAGALRMGRRGVLAQQLNAIEALASVDTLCIDKTGTLTASALRVVELLPAAGVAEADLAGVLGELAASASSRNGTLQAVAEAYPKEPSEVVGEVPFSSRRRWSAVSTGTASYYMGAPERFAIGSLSAVAAARQHDGRRVLALARQAAPLPDVPSDEPPAGLEPLGLVVLAEELRQSAREAIGFLRSEGVEVKVLSGDAPATVAAIARDVGVDVAGVSSGDEIPADGDSRRDYAEATTVIGRVSPDGKKAIVTALSERGRYVAMVGDGVNDVPALKAARLSIAQGSGTQMAKSVADLVLVGGGFEMIPPLVREGRRALRNLQRVSKLYLTKSAFAAFLIVTIGIGSDSYPLLPRQLTLVATLAIGIPTFFLALAPSTGDWAVEGFVSRSARFAVPAGAITGAGVVAGYLFALHDLDRAVAECRTVAVTILIVCGLYLVMALEAEGSRRRSRLVAIMCASLAGAYALVLLVPATRSFFELTTPDASMLATSLLASALTVGALVLCGFSAWVPVAADAGERL